MQRRRGLHRHDRHDLQQVALDHVDQEARLVVVARAILEPQGLVEADDDGFDIFGRPRRLEQTVGEAQAQHVEHGGAAEEVIDAEDLVLGHHAAQGLVQRSGARLIRAEGLFERESEPFGDVHSRELLARGLRDLGRDGEVEDRTALDRIQHAL